MRKLFKIHKFAGLSAGLVLLVLGLTGFLLDHKNWSWLYDVKVNNTFLPQSTIDKESRLYQTHLTAFDTIYIATKRGVYAQQGDHQSLSLDHSTNDIRFDMTTQSLYAATSDGIFVKRGVKDWTLLALRDSYVNAISVAKGKVFASVDKKDLYLVDGITGKTGALPEVALDLQQRDISLSRFVRDLHYGRGLFDDGWSLLLNDIAALYILLLAVTGYWMFVIIQRQRRGIKSKKHYLKKLTKVHANWMAVVLGFPFFILLVTGIFLDHARFFQPFLSSTKVPPSLQPTVYTTLHEDIWSVEYDAKSFFIGNRFGIFKSEDKKVWHEVSKGFGYKMMRLNDELFISGMGAPNRKQKPDGTFAILPKTPHMFKSVSQEESLKFHKEFPITYEDTSLYTIMLTLHDGSFFASWWIWINDYASVMLFVLMITGSIRYFRKKRLFRR